MRLHVTEEFVKTIKKNYGLLSYDDLAELILNDKLIPDKFSQGYYMAMLESKWSEVWNDEERDDDIIEFSTNILEREREEENNMNITLKYIIVDCKGETIYSTSDCEVFENKLESLGADSESNYFNIGPLSGDNYVNAYSTLNSSTIYNDYDWVEL